MVTGLLPLICSLAVSLRLLILQFLFPLLPAFYGALCKDSLDVAAALAQAAAQCSSTSSATQGAVAGPGAGTAPEGCLGLTVAI